MNKRLFGLLIAAAIILLVPIVAMQFSPEVNWSGFDFMVAGMLLLGTVFSIEVILRITKSSQKRLVFVLLILTALFLIWAELAVGIFGTSLAGS